MRPVGGILGGVLAFEGGTEYQGHGTPHFHGQAHVVCMYQFATLKEIADLIEANLKQTPANTNVPAQTTPIIKEMQSFQNWFHVERP